MPGIGCPPVVSRASSGSSRRPSARNADDSVIATHETWTACGTRAAIARSRSGTPTAMTSRMRCRSRSGQSGRSSTGSQIVSKAGERHRDPLGLEQGGGGRGSKCPGWTNAARAVSAATANVIPPPWKSGMAVQIRSAGVSAIRSAIPAASRTSASCESSAPFGAAVVPEV